MFHFSWWFYYCQGRADNFQEKLSTIGGTMGLLTGFSLISGVEILYFVFKIGRDFLNNIKWKHYNTELRLRNTCISYITYMFTNYQVVQQATVDVVRQPTFQPLAFLFRFHWCCIVQKNKNNLEYIYQFKVNHEEVLTNVQT